MKVSGGHLGSKILTFGKGRSKAKRGLRRKPKQARFSVSKSQYNINKAVSSAMSKMSETKLLAINEVNPGAVNGTPTRS